MESYIKKNLRSKQTNACSVVQYGIGLKVTL